MKLNKGLFLGSFMVGGIAVAAPSAEQVREGYFEFSKAQAELIDVSEVSGADIEVYGVKRAPLPNVPSTSTRSSGIPELDSAELILDKIINMGKKIWAIVEAGQPVVNFKTDVATAMPEGVQSWEQLSDWKTPKAYTYRVSYVNKFGIEVVKFDYRLIQTYGGGYRGVGNTLRALLLFRTTLV